LLDALISSLFIIFSLRMNRQLLWRPSGFAVFEGEDTPVASRDETAFEWESKNSSSSYIDFTVALFCALVSDDALNSVNALAVLCTSALSLQKPFTKNVGRSGNGESKFWSKISEILRRLSSSVLAQSNARVRVRNSKNHLVLVVGAQV
jgi:hypothetical protein